MIFGKWWHPIYGGVTELRTVEDMGEGVVKKLEKVMTPFKDGP